MAGEARRRGGRPADAAGAARGAPRPARAGRAERARARRDRGRDLPPRRRAGARTRGDPGDAAPGRARAQGADQTRQAAARRRGRLPLPPPADPRRRLRRAAEGDARRAARALRRLAGGARRRARRAGRDPRLPPRAGLPLPRRARDARTTTSWPRRRGGAWRPAATARPSARTTAPPSACSSAPPRSCRRPSSTSPSRPSSATPCSGQAGATTRSGAQMPSPSVPRRRAIVSASSAGGSRGACSASTSSRRARRRSWPRSSSRRCPCSRPPATTWLCTSPTPRSRRWRRCARRWTQRWRHYEQAFAHARQAGHVPAGFLAWRAGCRFFGTTPVSELLAWLDENEPRAGRDHFLRAYRAGRWRCSVASTRRARSSPKQRAELAERGGGVLLANITAFESVWVELWAGDPAAAAEFGAEGCRLHEELGEQSFLSSAAGNLAQALYALDRLDEADAWAGRAAELGASDDAWNEMLWRQVRAKVLARRGEHAEAERLAREAVAIGEETDMLDAQGDAYADLAEVLLLGGKRRRGSRRARAGARTLRAQGQPRLAQRAQDATRRASECSAEMSAHDRSGALLQSSPSRSSVSLARTTVPSPTEEAAILVTA